MNRCHSLLRVACSPGLVAMLLALGPLAAIATGDPASARPSARTIEQWQARKFGLFVHWGVYSVAGGVWQGRPIDGYNEQIMAQARIPVADYEALAGRFNPDKWDPDDIARLAREAGMKFVVMSAKHHDGFSMFHTRQSPYNIVDATPFKRDVLAEMAAACARQQLDFGVYFSTPDWHFPGGTGIDFWPKGGARNDNLITPAHDDFNVAQLTRAARWLATPGGADLACDNAGADKAVVVSAPRETPSVTVIVAEFDGELAVTPPAVSPDGGGRMVLLPEQADPFFRYNGAGYYERASLYKQRWHVSVPAPGAYRVALHLQPGPQAGGLQLAVGGRILRVDVPAGPAAPTPLVIDAGALDLPAAEALALTLTPSEPYDKDARLCATVQHLVLAPAR